jgi:hypothetical protein
MILLQIFVEYLQRVSTRLSTLSHKTIYDQFYSTSDHINLHKLNFSEISDEIQLVNLVEKFLSLTSPSTSSPNSPASLHHPPSPLRPTTATLSPLTLRRPTSPPSHPPTPNANLSDTKVLLSHKALQILHTLDNYINNYKHQTNLLKV